MRNKWLEQVEYIEVSENSLGEKNKIVIWNAENGDLYLTVCPHNHNGGCTIRIERSGGAITRNPNMVAALTNVYDAIAKNDTQSHIPSITDHEEFDKILKIIDDNILFIKGYSNIQLELLANDIFNDLLDKYVLIPKSKIY